jgi:hypothetical protein
MIAEEGNFVNDVYPVILPINSPCKGKTNAGAARGEGPAQRRRLALPNDEFEKGSWTRKNRINA